MEIKREIEANHKARLEFAKKERELKTGYLILTNEQILYYPSKKDWEKDQGTEEYKKKYPQEEISAATNLDLWHAWLKEREQISGRN
ncbi:hypothetical protein [endosymbiont GvMRE of Glomus versiforme]|uniref:hypothetical protein n=1 Tax=endosymbiont GvMRE of Glomus versiforme TaxID=2039283 RepID=UPI000ECAD5EA|nr:hypothetical protein [endosymbiont GvMRE of Glomus versiforme]RHZ37496.1 hypothetical protein GvMRE_I1g564 [endosymbiont GvMRE of Glomus versiforme]